MRQVLAVCAMCAVSTLGAGSVADEQEEAVRPSIRVGTFDQEVAKLYGDALPSADVLSVALGKDDAVYAITDKGLARFSDGAWAAVDGPPDGPAALLAHAKSGGPIREAVFGDAAQPVVQVQGAQAKLNCLCVTEADVYAGTEEGLFELEGENFVPVDEFNALLGEDRGVRAIAVGHGMAVGAKSGLFFRASEAGQPWTALHPNTPRRSWAPRDVRGVAFDAEGRLWFASPQGVGCHEPDGSWALYTCDDGVPYDDFTCVAAGGDRAVWFGTTMGAIRFDGTHWAYRQGPRWLPGDYVRAIAVAENGDAWFATTNGVGDIERRPTTLTDKAKFYEEEIDKYHRRTEYGYVIEAHLKAPGDRSESTTSDSDNDGLWTSMYGAGECFAYAATKDPLAKKRAKDAFEALRFLSVVTQGGTPPALPGFVARSVLPTSGPNPNETHYTREHDLERKLNGDALWKVIHPRWPTSADGKWYWKCDTSSDELDGHYFFYAQYYDLVADTEEEKQRVREVVTGLTDHLVAHDFNLVDWDGEPTRWGVFGPKQLNNNPAWFPERGLNSLSMLSYLAVAEHVTGDPKYRDAAKDLVNNHGYAMNLMYPKLQNGPGSNNQSDDEMAFMSFYNLVKYSSLPVVRAMTRYSFYSYWLLEQPELNPFFNFTYAGSCMGATYEDPWSVFDLSPQGAWLEESVDTLERFPLDLCNWRLTNSHRKDILPLPSYRREPGDAAGRGYRRNGYVLPVDERHFNHWNTDPWQLDYGGDGAGLSDGATFLLAYYMGLYHGFIAPE